jgi:hypothetical protein
MNNLTSLIVDLIDDDDPTSPQSRILTNSFCSNWFLLVFDGFPNPVQYPNYPEDHYPFLFDLNIEILDKINK